MAIPDETPDAQAPLTHDHDSSTPQPMAQLGPSNDTTIDIDQQQATPSPRKRARKEANSSAAKDLVGSGTILKKRVYTKGRLAKLQVLPLEVLMTVSMMQLSIRARYSDSPRYSASYIPMIYFSYVGPRRSCETSYYVDPHALLGSKHCSWFLAFLSVQVV
jgi:hypothetical protein